MSMTALPTETDFQTERGDCSSPPCVSGKFSITFHHAKT